MVLKLILTVLVVVVALGALRVLNRHGARAVPPSPKNKRVPEAEDLVRCDACGAYGPAGSVCRQCSDGPTP